MQISATEIASHESKQQYRMVDALTEQPELETQASTPTPQPNRVLRSSCFKYYIHDGIDACRFQLIGDLTEADIAELEGCWRTAKTMLGNRKFLLDLRGLNSVDEAGTKWVSGMAAEGAEYMRGAPPAEATSGPGRFRNLAAMFRGRRAPSSDPTQAQ